MSYETLLYDVSEHVLTITLNRPDRLNAFTGTMMNELIAAFDAADADDAVRAIIVTGAGRAFCAGAAPDHDARCNALCHFLHVGNHADLAAHRLQAVERIHRHAQGFRVEAAEAFVDEQRLDLHPVRRQRGQRQGQRQRHQE